MISHLTGTNIHVKSRNVYVRACEITFIITDTLIVFTHTYLFMQPKIQLYSTLLCAISVHQTQSEQE